MSNNQFIIIGLVAILLTVAALFFIDNKIFSFGGAKRKKEPELDYDDSEEENNAAIFYSYNHKSEEDWLMWINTKDLETREKAAGLLKNHLLGNPKAWGFVTLQVLNCIENFKKDIDFKDELVSFFGLCSKHWTEYKSIPSYYERVVELIINLDPDLAINIFQEELSKNNNSQSSLEKKRALVDNLPALKDKSISILTALLTSTTESYGTKLYALRKCEKYDIEHKNTILLQALNTIVTRDLDNKLEVKTEEAHFIKDLIAESMKNIQNFDFFTILRKASFSQRFHKYITEEAVAMLKNPRNKISQYELFALTNLKDNSQFDIKRIIGKRNKLEPAELTHIILPSTSQDTNKTKLAHAKTEALQLPIPEIFEHEFKEFKTLFFENINNHNYVTSEKIFGGVLITGDEAFKKLYYSRALAKEKQWNFAYINIASIKTKADFLELSETYNNLRKPYLLYIANPHILFERDGSDASKLRDKFVQMLTIQSLDTKSFLVGDILAPNDQIQKSSVVDKLPTLRSKFFPQAIEMNTNTKEFKFKVIEEYLRHIPARRFDNKRKLIDELHEKGKEMNIIEFCFFVVRSLKTMLLIFGTNCELRLLSQLETNFKNQSSLDIPLQIQKKSSASSSPLKEQESSSLQAGKSSINQ